MNLTMDIDEEGDEVSVAKVRYLLNKKSFDLDNSLNINNWKWSNENIDEGSFVYFKMLFSTLL